MAAVLGRGAAHPVVKALDAKSAELQVELRVARDLKTGPGYGLKGRVWMDGGDVFACTKRVRYVVQAQRLDWAFAGPLNEAASDSAVTALGWRRGASVQFLG